MKHKKILLTVNFILGIIMLFFAFIPFVIYGIFHVGVLSLLSLGSFLVVISSTWDKIKNKNLKILRNIIFAFSQLAIIIGLAISFVMIIKGYFNPPKKDELTTVIVLGCKIQDDVPSLMLKNRLDAAYQYLLFNDSSSCIVSGGLGEGEEYTEAQVMQKYLLEKGIEEKRIFLEGHSTSTEENISFSKDIIQRGKLPQNVAIATDSFHQMRAGIFAVQNGLTPYSLPAKTPWGLFPSYWVREFFAIIKAYFIQ